MKIAAVVILYHPPENIISNIQTYYNEVDKLYVFDNSETSSSVQNSFIGLSKISYRQDLSNLGIAMRLNTACALAITEGYDWLLTMDQDSQFSGNSISTYFDCFKQYREKENVAMFGTMYHTEKSTNSFHCNARETDRLITSGMLLNLEKFTILGGFDESLFIDLVDFEYCIAAKKAGFKIIQFTNVCISHNLGNAVYRSSIKSLYLIKKNKKEIHSSLRCYYMYRNMLYVQKKYKDADIEFVKEIERSVVSHIKVCMLYGRQAWGIIKYLLAARKDFRNNRMGKIRKELK